MNRELEGWQRFVVVFVGMVLAAGVCVVAAPFMVSPHGSIGPTVLQAESVVGAVTVTILLFAVAGAIACGVGRLVNGAVGLFVLGAGLWGLRLQLGTIEDLAFGDGSLGLAVVETFFWGAIVLAATLVMFRVAGPLTDIEPDPDADPAAPWWKNLELRGVAAGLVIIPAVWLLARSNLSSQTLVAVVVGSMAVGLVGRLVAPHDQPLLLFASPCIFGAVGQVIGMMMMKGTLIDAFVAGTIPTLNLPMPIDYAAGSLMGVSMGLGWAKSFLHHEETAAEVAS